MDNKWIILCLLIFAVGFSVSALITPLIGRLAVRLDIMDRPKSAAHKLHARATPLLGGAAVFLSWGGCAIVGFLLVHTGLIRRFLPDADAVIAGAGTVSVRFLWLIVSAGAATAIGLADDCRAMKAGRKFLLQFLVALLAVQAAGLRLTLFIENPWISGGISVFWFMLVMNAVNFFDNMDGLAAGTAAIAFVFFSLTSGWQGQYFIAALSALSAGAAGGFWIYNRNPARIFLGDAGSHLLGFLLAAVSVSVIYYNPLAGSNPLAVLLPLFILALPLFDTLAVVVIRTRNRKPFWIGDHNHISHRFVRMGMSPKQAVFCVHLLSIVTALSVWPLLWADGGTGWILLAQAAMLLMLISFLQLHVRGDGE